MSAKTTSTFSKIVLLSLCALVLLCGCEDGAFVWSLQKRKPDHDDRYVDGGVADLAKSAAFRDTIAERGWVEGLRRMRVRGYGIVVGLGTHGSRECPRSVRDRLVQEMYKRKEFSAVGLRPARLTPEQLIQDRDTAVVTIEGEIPAAASVGDTFDVMVRAIPGTQTTSLEGGRLFTANLHIYREAPTGSTVEGKVLAMADGPIFMNPFSHKKNAATRENTREGYIIGGGKLMESRRIRFVLSAPSYQRTQQITNAINARFPSARKIAEATSPSYINLRIPIAFREDPFHFLALVRHLYLSRRQGFSDTRAKELAHEILSETAPHADIAMAWEGIGRTVLPIMQKLYTNERPHVRFYSALAGLRLGDDVAVETLATFARASASSYRLTAIEAFGRNRKSYRAAGVLRTLLNDPDPRIRVEAYEALLARNDRTITSTPVGGGAFMLDRVVSAQENLVYVRRTGQPRIVLFGKNLRVKPPVFYQDPNAMLTINAEENAHQLVLIRRTPWGNDSSPPLPGPCELDELIRMLGDEPVVISPTDVHGLAIDYSTITHALRTLCSSQTINAKFMLQTTSVTEMFGPLTPTGRRESDL